MKTVVSFSSSSVKLRSCILLFIIFTLIMISCGPEPTPEPTNEIKKITIMFDTDDGSAVDPVEIDEDDTLPADYLAGGSKAPSKNGYRFDGWKNGTAAVNAATTFSVNTTLIAQWVPQVTITFNTDNGSALDPAKLDEGGSLPADYLAGGSKVPSKTGYRFNGWKNGTAAVSAATTFNADTTLVAQWVLQVTVSFSLGEEGVSETPPAPVIIDTGTALGSKYPSDPFLDGYEFMGWYNNGTKYINTTVINSNSPGFTLTAQWEEEEEYVVEYAQSPAIHPGNHFVEIVTGGELGVKVNQSFQANGLFSNIEKGAGVLSSQWYRATSETGEGEEIEWKQTAKPSNPHELSLPFTWKESEPGEYWYWVVVTNYNEIATVQKYNSSTTQNRLKVTVTGEESE